jgi:hypothetical protein
MGMSWDMEGKPNREGAVVQNLGSLLLLFGLFLFWVGTNAIGNADMTSKHLPIFVSSRAWLAFTAGLVLILPSTLALEYALDEGSQPVEAGRIGPVILFRLSGQTFIVPGATRLPLLATEPIAKAVESPLTFFLLGWILLGWSCFLPLGSSGTGVTVRKVSVLFFCLAIGVVDAVLLQPAFWQAASEAHQKWSYLYFGLLFWLAITIGLKGGAQLTLSVLGVMFLFIGQKTSWKDRKTGEAWLLRQPQEDSPLGHTKPTVFGTGQPIVIMGWILLCLSFSIPM